MTIDCEWNSHIAIVIAESTIRIVLKLIQSDNYSSVRATDLLDNKCPRSLNRWWKREKAIMVSTTTLMTKIVVRNALNMYSFRWNVGCFIQQTVIPTTPTKRRNDSVQQSDDT